MLNSLTPESTGEQWGRKGPGGLPGLQNRAGVGDPGAGGFDSHAPSPLKNRVKSGEIRRKKASSGSNHALSITVLTTKVTTKRI
jgi:hypothetical protein